MKKLSLLIVFLLAYCFSFSQYPVIQNLGAPKTLVVSKGGLSADSALILPVFADTNYANLSPYVKYYPGNMIRVGNQVYVRNATATAWIILAVSGTAVGSVQSVTQGYGVTATPNPITVSGTVQVDTTRATGLSNKYVRFTDTSNMLKTYVDNGDTAKIVSGYVRKSTTVATTAPLTGGGSLAANRTISIPKSTGLVDGYLSAADFDNFASKLSFIYATSPLNRIKFSNPVTGYTDSIRLYMNPATSIQDGYLSATQFNVFSNKVDTIYRTIGKDSIQFKINGRYYAIKDSTSGGGSSVSISQGYGITNTPNPITSTGTIQVDTATLSIKYLLKTDTTNKFVNNITRTPGKDSIIFFIGGNRYAIKDSVGSGGGGGGVTQIIAGTNISISPAGGTGAVTINSTASGSVTAVTASAPLASSGGTTPNISIPLASSSSDGYLNSTNWNVFNSKISNVTATGLLTSTGGGSPDISSSVSAGKLVGRNPSTSGIMQEITLGSGLSLTGTTLSATGGGGGGSQNLQQVLDTGYTLNGNFYFQTNSTDSVVNLSGTRLSAPRTYEFPDSSGIIALKSDLLPFHYQIDLSASGYTIANYGVYEIKTATDSATPYYIIFPDANDFVGQRISLVNADRSGFQNNAIIDTSGNETTRPKYQGTDTTIWQIPYGMTYEFLSINGRWMSTNPMPVITKRFDIDEDVFIPTIPFGGIYKTYDAAPAKNGGKYKISFPDPKKNNGERITLINTDSIYNLVITGTWIPVSKNTFYGAITRIAPQSTYEFVSIDSQWVCVNMSTPPTYINIDLTAADFNIPSCGVYFFSVTSATYSANLPANAEWYDGRQVILINNDGSTALDITGATNPDGTGYTSLAAGAAATLVSIGNKWVKIN